MWYPFNIQHPTSLQWHVPAPLYVPVPGATVVAFRMP